MNKDEVKDMFDQQAASYNKQWEVMAPINNALYFFLESIFAKIHSEARILCVGVGTGNELLYLAERFPKWQFTAVEPSSAMLNICRQTVEKAGFTSRCNFHEGYLDTLPVGEYYDAATCFLVSHFILEQEARSELFQQIANNLKPSGILVSLDLASDSNSDAYEKLLNLWLAVMLNSEASDEAISKIKAVYSKDVALVPPSKVASIIESGGFEFPVQFFQLGMMHGFFTRRSS